MDREFVVFTRDVICLHCFIYCLFAKFHDPSSFLVFSVFCNFELNEGSRGCPGVEPPTCIPIILKHHTGSQSDMERSGVR